MRNSNNVPGQHGDDRYRAQAVYATQAAWIMALTHERGGEVWRAGELRAARWPDGGAILLPDHSLERADLDAALAWFREEPPADGILVWAAHDGAVAPLAARGCDPSFRPHWMWRDLERPGGERDKVPPSCVVRPAAMSDRSALARATGLPYAHPEVTAAVLQMMEQAPAAQSAWLIIAESVGEERRQRRTIVGQAALYLPRDGARFAGLFDVGVVPDARRQGVGEALVRYACAVAREHGAAAIGLNATPEGERLYQRLGFDSAGLGQTWVLPAERLPATARRAMIAFAEALAAGDLTGLSHAAAGVSIPLSLLNGDSPLAYAARVGQLVSARWLLERGVTPEILPLWTLGLRDEARAAMEDAALREARLGVERATPLHEAVRRNDEGLVCALISAGADRAATDSTWHATPAGWARALGRNHLLPLLGSR